MKSMMNAMRLVVLAALVTAGLTQQAAASTISISPAVQIVPAGPVSVDIVVSGLLPGETVGAFSLVLGYDPSILSGIGYLPDPAGAMGLGFDGSGGFGPPGTLDLFYGSTEPAASEAAFKALQGASFVLASVTFGGIANGASPLTLSILGPGGAFLSDWAGFELPLDSVAGGSICVSDAGLPPGVECAPGPPAIPEPATLTLLGVGVSALVAIRRRRASPPRA